jgi:hypothetical protein
MTGATVQLTRYRGHSVIYFTYPAGRYRPQDHHRLDREKRELYWVSGDITSSPISIRASPINVFVSRIQPEKKRNLQGKPSWRSTRTLEAPFFTVPHTYVAEGANATADGKFIGVGFYQDLSDQFDVDLDNGYIGFHEYWAARPHSMIVRVSLDDGSTETVFEENYWLGHFNTSPKLPHIMTFCHEGPWDKVDNRIWGLDMGTGKAWKIRPTEPGEASVTILDAVRRAYRLSWPNRRRPHLRLDSLR